MVVLCHKWILRWPSGKPFGCDFKLSLRQFDHSAYCLTQFSQLTLNYADKCPKTERFILICCCLKNQRVHLTFVAPNRMHIIGV